VRALGRRQNHRGVSAQSVREGGGGEALVSGSIAANGRSEIQSDLRSSSSSQQLTAGARWS
jgi:hypothetical protein